MRLSSWELESHAWNEEDHRNEVFYVIVYPRGNTKKLAVAQVQDFDIPDYSIASRHWFNDEQNAARYAVSLAEQNGLQFDGDPGRLLD